MSLEVQAVQLDEQGKPLPIEGSLGNLKPVAPSEQDIVEHFRARLRNIKEAVQLARTVPRGAVQIS